MSIAVRDMRPDEAAEVLELHYRSWADTYVSPEHGVTREWIDAVWAPRRTPERARQVGARIAAGPGVSRRVFLVAELDGRLAGLAMPFVQPDDGRQRVGALYVDPELLGRGVGAALLRRVLEWADAAQPLWLEVASYNDRAIRFYERFGFVRVPGTEQVFDGVVPEFTMRLDPPLLGPLGSLGGR